MTSPTAPSGAATRAPVPSVKTIDMNAFEPGREHRLRVEMMRSAAGGAIQIPVLLMRGAHPGPTLGVTAALHGDELNGVAAIHALLDRVNPETLSGTILAVPIVNLPGFLRHQRTFSDGTDLNHIMPGKPRGAVAYVYAHRFVERVLKRMDVLIDLHTASFGRINSLYVRADLMDAMAARLAALQRAQIVLHSPANEKTLRGVATALGIPAITVEIGDPHRFQRHFISRSVEGLLDTLNELGMTRERGSTAQPDRPAMICSSSDWIYTDRGGLLEVPPKVTERVDEGELLAWQVDAFGDRVRDYHALRAGVVIGKSVHPASQTGARVLHLGNLDLTPLGDVQGRLEAPLRLEAPFAPASTPTEEQTP